MSWENVADENEYLTFWQPKRPFLCSDLWKESSSVDKNQLQNISCYIFLQLDMLDRKSWMKWRVKSGSEEFTLKTLLKVLAVPKSLQSWLKTSKDLILSCVLYKSTEKYRYFIFRNPGIGIWVKSRYTGIFRYTAGAWRSDYTCLLL